jgi:hypothetical protein
MKKLFFIVGVCFITVLAKGQNLVLNPSFEEFWMSTDCHNGYGLNFEDTIQIFDGACFTKYWRRDLQTPDIYSVKNPVWDLFTLPKNNSTAKYVYPHSGDVCLGEGYLYKANENLRETTQGTLAQALIGGHSYQFSMWVQLIEKNPWGDVGKIVGSNKFSAHFTTNSKPINIMGSIVGIVPQVNITQLVTDTQYWTLVADTFVAAGGEKYFTIGNYNVDSLTQFVVVDSIDTLPEMSYYFIDDVSLIDLDAVGIASPKRLQQVGFKLYPNPSQGQISLEWPQAQAIQSLSIVDAIGRQVWQQSYTQPQAIYTINLPAKLQGMYICKALLPNGSTQQQYFIVHK